MAESKLPTEHLGDESPAAPQAEGRGGASPALERSDAGELRKPHEMIVMIPQSNRVTLTGRRVYNALLQVAQSRLSAMDAVPSATYMFEAPLPAILRTTGSSGEDRTAAKRYLKEMETMRVTWESTAPGDGLKLKSFGMLAQVEFEVRKGENWVRWAYPPAIMEALYDPARWARIDLQVLARLGTYAGVALYEICARYRDNPGGLTSRKPVQWWTDALSPTPPGSERREWRKFKNERVKVAIEEINRETDLEIELVEHKQGRSIAEVQFAVRRKRPSPGAIAYLSAPVDANLVLRAEALGIRELKLEGLMREFGDDTVREKLSVLERRVANREYRSLDNAYSYLRALLRNDTKEQDEPKPTPPVVVKPAVAAANPEHEWLASRIAEIKTELGQGDPAQRQIWVDRALAELSERQQLNAVIRRRVAQGDVLHGLLGATVVRLYAQANYGPDWDRPPAELPFGEGA
jgi:hypothetical protein